MLKTLSHIQPSIPATTTTTTKRIAVRYNSRCIGTDDVVNSANSICNHANSICNHKQYDELIIQNKQYNLKV